jgi:hypothetical protein
MSQLRRIVVGHNLSCVSRLSLLSSGPLYLNPYEEPTQRLALAQGENQMTSLPPLGAKEVT